MADEQGPAEAELAVEQEPSGWRYRSGELACLGDIICGPTQNKRGVAIGIVVRDLGGTVEIQAGIRLVDGAPRIDTGSDWADPAKLVKIDLSESTK